MRSRRDILVQVIAVEGGVGEWQIFVPIRVGTTTRSLYPSGHVKYDEAQDVLEGRCES